MTARRRSDHALDVTLELDAGLDVFEGHFRGHPILPGVAQIAWAQQLAAETFCPGHAVTGLEQLKFRAPVVPGMSVVLHLAYQPERERVLFEYRQANELMASGRLKLDGGA
ncbi:MAG: hydroxymyristoyl-ACP dehydratase [Gammaproteobacteria bacterium]